MTEKIDNNRENSLIDEQLFPETETSNENEAQPRNNNRSRMQRPMSVEKKVDYSSIKESEITYVADLRSKTINELVDIATSHNITNIGRMLKQDIVCAILKTYADSGKHIVSEGILDVNDDGYGFLRYVENNYRTSSDDCYVSHGLIRSLALRSGDKITCFVRPPKGNEKFFACTHVSKLEGQPVNATKHKINFDNLTPIHAIEKFNFGAHSDESSVTTRVMDLVAPIGKGQRALIVAPPRTGKTYVLKAIASALNHNHPEVHLIALLIDERPEEVTDMQRSIKGDVISSNFDEPTHRHVAIANLVIERAKRMVEAGKDVVILLDSITRLARAYNAVEPSSGKVLTGGVDSNALQKPKRFFGAARKIENGGSLTIIGTALVDTGSKMDEVIFEEFKGTGNSEIVLDRNIANRRIFPAIDIIKSGTRKEEDMINKEDLAQLWMLRKLLVQMSNTAGNGSTATIDFLLKKIKSTKSNSEFFETMSAI